MLQAGLVSGRTELVRASIVGPVFLLAQLIVIAAFWLSVKNFILKEGFVTWPHRTLVGIVLSILVSSYVAGLSRIFLL